MTDKFTVTPNISSSALADPNMGLAYVNTPQNRIEQRKQLIRAEIDRIRDNMSLSLNAYHTYRRLDIDPRVTDIELYEILEDLSFCYTDLCDDLRKLVGIKTYVTFYNYPFLIEDAHAICEKKGIWLK